ncbi:hypothetical protein EV361DRAFT_442632 [Lentinula raphanica]|uniref:Uncharacterized protein n=1 Tax=Lentinula raphanica TaxID=153919 RepID=A0AA38P4R2_9AGAR|nr:hypothetical protein F5878DRAFT_625505 [Lentinula raphanica]KAJ3968068.1 hypothetical protein EV361DRAFT_442632 [Lentinula raphanica]
MISMTFYNPQTGRIDIPPPNSRPKNPLCNHSFDAQRTESLADEDHLSNFDSSVTAFSEVQKIRTRDDKVSLRKLLRTDQREFITGTFNANMQASHILNAICINGCQRETKRKMKLLIEGLLTRFWFNNGDAFELDSRANMILLSNNNHSALDLYGLIGLSPGLDRLKKINDQLLFDNAHWAFRVANGLNRNRNLNMNVYPYDTDSIEWEVLVLHRDDFIPSGERLFVVHPDDRTLHGEQAVNQRSTLCHIPNGQYDSDLPLLVDDSNNATLKFRMRTKREPFEKLSLFAMLVNLHSKVKACTTLSGTPFSIFTLYGLLEDTINRIFYEPDGVNLRFELHQELSKQRSPSTMDTDSSFPSMPSVPNTHHTPSAEHSFPDSEMASGHYDRDDDEILDERGLTEKEVNIGLAEVFVTGSRSG